MPDKANAQLVMQPIVVDRAAFNQGENAQYQFRAEHSETMDSLVARGPHAVLQPIAVGTDLYNLSITGDVAACMSTEGSTSTGTSPTVMQPVGFDSYNLCQTGDVMQTLKSPSGGVTESIGAVLQSMAVRRLTPVECERLQGFPDSYTDIKSKNKPTPDGPRYKALGNSMAVPVMAWIGKRIQQFEEMA